MHLRVKNSVCTRVAVLGASSSSYLSAALPTTYRTRAAKPWYTASVDGQTEEARAQV